MRPNICFKHRKIMPTICVDIQDMLSQATGPDAGHWCGMLVQHTGAGCCREIVPQSENELSAAKRPDRYYNEIHYPYELMATSATTTYRVLLKKNPRTTGPYRPVILSHPSSFASRQVQQGQRNSRTQTALAQ